MKTAIALALALATTACGQLSPADSSVSNLGETKDTSISATVSVNAPAAPEVTARPVVEQATGSHVYGSLTCDFSTRLCDDGSVVSFDDIGPMLCSASGEITTTVWADWTQAD